MKLRRVFLFVTLAGIVQSRFQAQSSKALQDVVSAAGAQQFVPSKTLDFKPVESDPDFPLPPTTTGYPHCESDGALVLDALDVESLNTAAVNAASRKPLSPVNYTSITIRGKRIQTVSSSAISDLNDLTVWDVFPADSGLFFLVRGSKEQPGERGRGKSQAGIPWSTYRNYIARFDTDGVYKGTTEIQIECDFTRPGHCDVSHLAVFPNGDFLITESDPANSVLRLLYLNSSGAVVKPIDIPAGRKPLEWGEPDSNPSIRQEARTYLASVFFSASDQNILVWHSNSDDPILELRPGGAVREVPLQIPPGYRFVDMLTANDKWVAHFRTLETPSDARMSKETDSYYEVRPQDGSIAARLVEKGDAPPTIACESNGTYTAFKMSDMGKLILLKAD